MYEKYNKKRLKNFHQYVYNKIWVPFALKLWKNQKAKIDLKRLPNSFQFQRKQRQLKICFYFDPNKCHIQIFTLFYEKIFKMA